MGSGRGIGSPSQRLTASAAHAIDGELASECWKTRTVPITHVPARLVQHVLPCRRHTAAAVEGSRNSAREKKSKALSWLRRRTVIVVKSLAHTSLDAGELAW